MPNIETPGETAWPTLKRERDEAVADSVAAQARASEALRTLLECRIVLARQEEEAAGRDAWTCDLRASVMRLGVAVGALGVVAVVEGILLLVKR